MTIPGASRIQKKPWTIYRTTLQRASAIAKSEKEINGGKIKKKKESKSPIVQSLFLPHILFEVGRSVGRSSWLSLALPPCGGTNAHLNLTTWFFGISFFHGMMMNRIGTWRRNRQNFLLSKRDFDFFNIIRAVARKDSFSRHSHNARAWSINSVDF